MMLDTGTGTGTATATGTVTAAGAASSDRLASARPGAGTGPTAGAGGAREGKRWLAAQGRPGRRFFLAAGVADLAATAGTVILSWYVAALIVAGVVGAAAGHRACQGRRRADIRQQDADDLCRQRRHRRAR